MENLFFGGCWLVVFFCIKYGVNSLLKKKWLIGILNISIPISLVMFYLASNVVIDNQHSELERFDNQLLSGVVEAKVTVVLFVCLIILFAFDVFHKMLNSKRIKDNLK